MVHLRSWRYGAFIGGIVGFIGLALYPIVIDPMINPEKYKRIQQETRRGIKQEEVQPGNMRVWSDPFAPRKGSK